MREYPKVDIILVNYNGALDTIECLESLKNIYYKNYEVIVVDNASTDDSVLKLRNYNKDGFFTLLHSQENRGFSAGNNIGIKKALADGSDYVLLLNNDTIVTPNFLSILVDASLKCKQPSAISGAILYYYDQEKIWYGGGNLSKYTGRTTHSNINQSYISISKGVKRVTFLSGCEMLLPRVLIENVGFLDENYFLYSEDADYCFRVHKYGYSMLFVPKSVIFHKVSASTSKISKATSYYSARNRRLLIYKNFSGLNILTAIVFTNIQALHRILHKRLDLKSAILGIKDFYSHKFGKTNRVL